MARTLLLALGLMAAPLATAGAVDADGAAEVESATADDGAERAAPVQSANYRIGAGDVLSIRIFGENELSGTYLVGSDGTYNFPLLRQVAVHGKTTREAEEALREALLGDYLVDPHVTVKVAEYRSQKVEIYGAVQKPGAYYLTGPTTVREILAEAGWIDAEKSTRQVVVARHDGSTLKLSLDDLLDAGVGDVEIVAGDRITVQEGKVVYVQGEVANPGAVPFAEGLTVSQAIARAGGPSAYARLRGAYVLRDGDKIVLNLKKVWAGKEADVALQPGDQLFLKESAF